MNKLRLKPVLYWLAVFAGYILSTLFLVVLSTMYPIGQQMTSMREIAVLELNKFTSGAYDTIGVNPDVRKIYFTPDGAMFHDFAPDVAWPLTVPDETFSHVYNISVSKGEYFNIYYDDSLNDIIAVKALTVREADGPYTIILLRNLKNIPEVVEGLVIGFTFLYILFVIFLIFWRRKKVRMELLQKNYVANVTHALKAPIASVQALTEALVDVVPTDADQQHPYFEMIFKATRTQSHMVNEILTLSRLQNRTLDTAKSRINVQELFGDILDEYESMCECSGISFHVEDSFRTLYDTSVHTNPACMQQIMEILLENAVKYLDINGRGVLISAEQSKKFITICVNDEGSVISASDLPHVFEQFYIGENGKGRQSSGLGLAIAKAEADILHEKIWIESSSASGTSVYFTIHR